MSSNTPNMDELRRRISNIQGLLNDPHPGLMTWTTALQTQMADLYAWWFAPRANARPGAADSADESHNDKIAKRIAEMELDVFGVGMDQPESHNEKGKD